MRDPVGEAYLAAWQTVQKPLAGNRKNQAGFRHPQTQNQANARAGEGRQTTMPGIRPPQPHTAKPSEAGSPQPKRPARALAGKPPGGGPKPGQIDGNQANAGGKRRGIPWEGYKAPGEGKAARMKGKGVGAGLAPGTGCWVPRGGRRKAGGG